MTHDEKQLQLLEQIELNTKSIAQTMSFFRNLTWVIIVIFLLILFFYLIDILSK